MNGILGEINLSSRDVRFRQAGLLGNSILFAFEQGGIFPHLRYELRVKQIQ